MTAGISIVNDWGTVQVDDQWAAMSLRHKVQVSISAAAGTFGYAYNGYLTIAAKSPLVFWKATAPIYILAAADNGNGTWTFTFRSYIDPATATVYVFDTPEWATQNYGLEVFNANGVKVFGDQLSPLKIAAIAPIGAVPFIWDGLPAGQYAVTTSDPGFMCDTYYADKEYTASYSCGATDRPNGGSCDWVLSRDRFPFVTAHTEYPAKYLIVADVSGM